MVMSLEHCEGRRVRACWDGTELFSYTYVPPEPQLESPRPYFHPVRTLKGDLVTLYRPHDHVWHKGIAWSLPNVGPENFWGGPTYRRGDAYLQLDNNGAMRPTTASIFVAIVEGAGGSGEGRWAEGGAARVDERLSWVTAVKGAGGKRGGEVGGGWGDLGRRAPAGRRRSVAGHVGVDARVRDHHAQREQVPDAVGSPTTEGRENAGYGGLLWRGPRSFTNGRVITPDGEGTGDAEFMGWRGPWLAFAGTTATGVPRPWCSGTRRPTSASPASGSCAFPCTRACAPRRSSARNTRWPPDRRSPCATTSSSPTVTWTHPRMRRACRPRGGARPACGGGGSDTMTADPPIAAEGRGSAPADARTDYAERARGGTPEAGPVPPEVAFPGRDRGHHARRLRLGRAGRTARRLGARSSRVDGRLRGHRRRRRLQR